jgi:hypothetical protein
MVSSSSKKKMRSLLSRRHPSLVLSRERGQAGSRLIMSILFLVLHLQD